MKKLQQTAKKPSLEKLRISTKTVRDLTESQLEGVAGGDSLTSGSIWGGGCCFGCGCRQDP